MSQGIVIWLFGLSGAGKSTIAHSLEQQFIKAGMPCERLDGDLFRKEFATDLGFTSADRKKNIERAVKIAGLLSKHGVHVIASFITPYEEMRQYIRKHISHLLEVFVDCPLEICMKRDPKGLYRKVKSGEISRFTGISDPFEPPAQANLVLPTHKLATEACVDNVIHAIIKLEPSLKAKLRQI